MCFICMSEVTGVKLYACDNNRLTFVAETGRRSKGQVQQSPCLK